MFDLTHVLFPLELSIEKKIKKKVGWKFVRVGQCTELLFVKILTKNLKPTGKFIY